MSLPHSALPHNKKGDNNPSARASLSRNTIRFIDPPMEGMLFASLKEHAFLPLSDRCPGVFLFLLGPSRTGLLSPFYNYCGNIEFCRII